MRPNWFRAVFLAVCGSAAAASFHVEPSAALRWLRGAPSTIERVCGNDSNEAPDVDTSDGFEPHGRWGLP
jgi:hypothetical protein